MRFDATQIERHCDSCNSWLIKAGLGWQVWLERDESTRRWSVWKRWPTGSRSCTASRLTNRETVALLEGIKIALESVVSRA